MCFRSQDIDPTHFVASEGHVGVVDLLLEEGALYHIPNRDQRTALHVAAANSRTDVVTSLLSHVIATKGLGSDETVSFVRAQDIFGCSSLWLAAQSGMPETVQFLLKAGADPETPEVPVEQN